MAAEPEFEFTRTDFEKIRSLIYKHAGITLADGKRQLVYGRLSRRLRILHLHRFSDYIDRLSPDDIEWQQFTNALTTNLTAFFREQHHFPLLAQHVRGIRRRPIHIWSAAASSGEEPYSIAMTIADAFGKLDPPVKILATDLDTHVLEIGRAGIYPLERLEKLSPELKRKFFFKGSGQNEGFGKVIPELQDLIEFRQLNLLDRNWRLNQKFDAIFCRNVMIYFDKPTQHKLLEKFVQMLQPDGLFFAGHSESFFHASELVTSIGRTVYKPAQQKLSTTDIQSRIAADRPQPVDHSRKHRLSGDRR